MVVLMTYDPRFLLNMTPKIQYTGVKVKKTSFFKKCKILWGKRFLSVFFTKNEI